MWPTLFIAALGKDESGDQNPETSIYFVNNGSPGPTIEELIRSGFPSGSVTGRSFNFSSNASNVTCCVFRPNGLLLYVTRAVGGSGAILQYAISSAWDVSTASLDKSLNVDADVYIPNGIFFKPDGSVLYVCGVGISSQDWLAQYDLSTPWDIGSAVFRNKTTITASGLTLTAMSLKPDGTKLYLARNLTTGDEIRQYTLSPAWDISTLSDDGAAVTVSGQDSTPSGMYISKDGATMYTTGDGTNSIFKYLLSTAWDISSASFSADSWDLDNYGLSNPRGICLGGTV